MTSSERARIENAIAALEAQRSILGDEVVDTSLLALRQQLAALGLPEQEERRRKLATILFADIVDSTAIVRDMDPEDNLALMGTALRRLAASVEKYGGHVHRFMGDGLMAVFGHPVAREDDPDQAVRCGLEMLTVAADYAGEAKRRWDVTRFHIRVGVNTGPVVLMGQGAGEDTIMGVAVNLAARVEGAAAPDTLLISHETYQHVRGAFDLTPLPAISAKGFPEPVPVYQVRRAKPRSFRTRRRGVEGQETRMIGRDDMLARLQKAHEVVANENTIQIFTVVGEAGIGKSRLLYEFENWVDLQTVDITLYRGRAHQETCRQPFSLLRDMFAFRFDIQDDDYSETVREKMEAGFREARISAAATPETLPVTLDLQAYYVAQLLGYRLGDGPPAELRADPQQFHNQAQAYLIDYFRCVAAAGPILMLLEDLHWADESSLETLQALMVALRNRPVLVLAATRPQLHERYPEWLTWLPGHQRLDLKPLSTADSRTLVDEVLQRMTDIPDRLCDLIVANAGGNPYYVEELIKMLLEDGVIIKGEETWHARPELLADLQVPATLTGVLQARLEGLTPAERTVLQQAAVIGRVFWDAAVAHVAEWTAPDTVASLQDNMAALQQKDMVYRRESSAFADTAERIFKHAILRAVTYESVLKQTRQQYHALAAEWLLTQSGDRVGEYASIIADHLEQANRRAEASIYLHEAANAAAAAFANTEAADYYSRALDLCPDDALEMRYELLSGKAQILHRLGWREEQTANLNQLAELAQQSGNLDRQAEAAYFQCLLLANTGDSPGAVDAAQKAITLARQTKNYLTEAKGRLAWGRVLWRLEDFTAAHNQLQQALQLARQVGDREIEGNALLNLGNVADDMGASRQAKGYYEASLAIDRELGDKAAEGISLNNLGILAAQAGKLDEARDYFEQALAAARLTGYRQAEGLALGNLGNVTADMGDYESSRQFLKEYLTNTIEIRNRPGQGHALHSLGFASLQLGEFAAAAAYFEQAASLRSILKQPHLALESRAGWARALLGQGKPAAALALIEPILRHLEIGDKDRADELTIYHDCVVVLQANNDPRARPLLEKAYTQLQAEANQISDPAARQVFLENVTVHRELCRLWQNQT